MENPDLVFHIPEKELTDTASLLDAIKAKIVASEVENGFEVFLRSPRKGLLIEVVHPDFDKSRPENSLTIHVSFEAYSL